MAFCFLGIDPGLSGALAVRYGRQLVVHDVPTVGVKVGRTVKRRIDAKALAALIRRIAAVGVDKALTENVNGWSRPKCGRGNTAEPEGCGQSASAAFAFGKVCGQIEQALACHEIPYTAIAPAAWKRAMGLIGQDKTAARQLAMQLYPEHKHLFARAKDDGRAEAALLAHYASTQPC